MEHVRNLIKRGTAAVLNTHPMEVLVREATGNEHWGPTGTQMQKIAQSSHYYEDYVIIMQTLWKRLSLTGKNWKNVYKALLVLDYLIKNGTDRVIDECRSHMYQIKSLHHFQYRDEANKDQGLSVRERSKQIVELLHDDKAIKMARKTAAKNRGKYEGFGSHQSRGPGGYDTRSRYSGYDNNSGRDESWREDNGKYNDFESDSDNDKTEDVEEDDDDFDLSADPEPTPAPVQQPAPAQQPTHFQNTVQHDPGWTAFATAQPAAAVDPFGMQPAAPASQPTHSAFGNGAFVAAPVAAPAVSVAPITHPAVHQAPMQNLLHAQPPALTTQQTALTPQSNVQSSPAVAHPGLALDLLSPEPTTAPTNSADLLQPVESKQKKPADDPWASLVDLSPLSISDTNSNKTKKINFKPEKSSRTIAPVAVSPNFPRQQYGFYQ